MMSCSSASLSTNCDQQVDVTFFSLSLSPFSSISLSLSLFFLLSFLFHSYPLSSLSFSFTLFLSLHSLFLFLSPCLRLIQPLIVRFEHNHHVILRRVETKHFCGVNVSVTKVSVYNLMNESKQERKKKERKPHCVWHENGAAGEGGRVEW